MGAKRGLIGVEEVGVSSDVVDEFVGEGGVGEGMWVVRRRAALRRGGDGVRILLGGRSLVGVGRAVCSGVLVLGSCELISGVE